MNASCTLFCILSVSLLLGLGIGDDFLFGLDPSFRSFDLSFCSSDVKFRLGWWSWGRNSGLKMMAFCPLRPIEVGLLPVFSASHGELPNSAVFDVRGGEHLEHVVEYDLIEIEVFSEVMSEMSAKFALQADDGALFEAMIDDFGLDASRIAASCSHVEFNQNILSPLIIVH